MGVEIKKEGNIAIITLNRPQALNALDPPSVGQLSYALLDLRTDDHMWVGIVTGAGEKAFCAGADIKTMLASADEIKKQFEQMPPTILRGLDLWKPLIAAVNGMALGGGLEIALACDLRVASENAVFGLPEVRIGLIPGWGGTQRLIRTIPRAKAAELLFTGQPIDAHEAYRIGLVNKVVPQEQVMPEAMKMAKLLCEAGPLALRAAKQAMIQGASLSLDDGLRLEATLAQLLLDTEDFKEGVQAFVEKRKPRFKGR